MDVIKKENIIVGLEVDNRNEAIMALVERLEKNGHIGKAYYDDVIEREKTYPTGLPTEGVKIAIPHASSNAIIDSTIGMATLTKPVQFVNMADDTDILDVEIVFLIANEAEDEQAKLLMMLMEYFSEEDVLLKLKNAKTSEEVFDIITAL